MNRVVSGNIFMEKITFNHIAGTELRSWSQSATATAGPSGQFIDALRNNEIVSEITCEKLPLGDNELTIYSLAYVVPANETDGHLVGDVILTNGASLDPIEALSKAYGELCERCARKYAYNYGKETNP